MPTLSQIHSIKERVKFSSLNGFLSGLSYSQLPHINDSAHIPKHTLAAVVRSVDWRLQEATLYDLIESPFPKRSQPMFEEFRQRLKLARPRLRQPTSSRSVLYIGSLSADEV